MKNYQYTVASLPELLPGAAAGVPDTDAVIAEIRESCDKRDNELLDFLVRSFSDENLTEDFYREALAHGNSFIREYFAFDLKVRNAKVRHLNTALSRPAGQDEIVLSEEEEEEDGFARIFSGKDIIAREKAVDNLYWEKLDELSLMHYFDMNVIMAFILKLRIVNRWNLLDEAAGREMFRKLVEEVRGTFKGVGAES